MGQERRPQHGKNRKRPRGWHRGPGAFREQEKPLKRIEKAAELEARLQTELADVRRAGRDETATWQSLAHVNPPAGLALWPAWL